MVYSQVDEEKEDEEEPGKLPRLAPKYKPKYPARKRKVQKGSIPEKVQPLDLGKEYTEEELEELGIGKKKDLSKVELPPGYELVEEEAPLKGRWSQLAEIAEFKPGEIKSAEDSELPEGYELLPADFDITKPFHEQTYKEKTARVMKETFAGVPKGVARGLTLGFSEMIPGMKPEEDEMVGAMVGETIASVLPISRMINIAQKPLLILANKSPYIKNQLSAFARLTGTTIAGGLHGGITQSTKEGELASVDDVLEHGALWGMLDAGLNGLGLLGRFGKRIYEVATNTGRSQKDVLRDITNRLTQAGITDQSPTKVATLALEFLDAEAERAAQNLARQQTATQASPSQAIPTQGAQAASKPQSPVDDPYGFYNFFGGFAKGMSDSFFDNVWKALDQGININAFKKDPFFLDAKLNYESGAIKSRDDLKKYWDYRESIRNPQASPQSQPASTAPVSGRTVQYQKPMPKEKALAEEVISDTGELIGRKEPSNLPGGSPFGATPGRVHRSFTAEDLSTKRLTPEQVAERLKVRYEVEPRTVPQAGLEEEADALAETAARRRINQHAERAPSNEILGRTIGDEVEQALEAEKKVYRQLYVDSGDLLRTIYTKETPKTGTKIYELIESLESLKTKPAGYERIIKHLEEALEDAGWQLQRDAEGILENAVQTGETNLSKATELKRRLNEIVNFESIEADVSDRIMPVIKALKKDIDRALVDHPAARKAYKKAEKAFQKTAQKYGRDSIKGIRTTQAGEQIYPSLLQPTTLSDLSGILSPQRWRQVEREILEKMHGQSYSAAQDTLREVDRFLTGDARQTARDIVNAKNKFHPSRRNLKREGVLEDLADAMDTGARPEKTLTLWKTPRGRNLVEEALQGSPNREAMINYLESQTLADMASSVIGENSMISLPQLRNFLSDRNNMRNLQRLGGDDAVTFFQNLERDLQSFDRNVNLLDTIKELGDTKLDNATKNFELGWDILRRSAQKRKEPPRATKLLQETAEKRAEQLKERTLLNKERGTERGKELINRMVSKDFPTYVELNRAIDAFAQSMNMNTKALLTLWAVRRVGVPKPVLFLVGHNLMKRLMTSPKFRDSMKKLSKPQTNPFKFLGMLEAMGALMEQEGIDKNTSQK